MKKPSVASEAVRPIFAAPVGEWLLLLAAGFLLWAAMFVLGRFTNALVVRDATRYPVLACLLAPAVTVAAVAASSRWGAATGAAVCSMGFFLAFTRVTPPLLVIPALAVDVWYAYRGNTRGLGGGFMAGFLFAWVFYAAEAAWTLWRVGVGWPRQEILGGLLFALLAGVISGAIGQGLGAWLRALRR